MVADVYIQLSMSHSLDQLCSTSILDHYVMQPLKLVLHTVLHIIIIIDIIKNDYNNHYDNQWFNHTEVKISSESLIIKEKL